MSGSRIEAELRRFVKLRAGKNCEYCLALGDYSFHPFSVDHIIPVSKGGTDDPDNLAYCCQFCNSSKYSKTSAPDPLTAILVPLYNPRTEAWERHFAWDKNLTYILGITPIGRATAHCLNMNRQEAVNLREALREFGVHPPMQK